MRINRSSRFKRSFKKLPATIQIDFAEKVTILVHNPFQVVLHTHKLSGNLAEYYAFNLKDGYRVLFDFVGDDVILFVNVGNHDSYRKWSHDSD